MARHPLDSDVMDEPSYMTDDEIDHPSDARDEVRIPSRGPSDNLLGFGDFFQDVSLGAAKKPPARPPASKSLASSRKFKPVVSRKAANKGKPSPHKSAILHTIAAGKKAIEFGKKAATSAAQYKANAKGGRYAPLVKVAPTKVRGDGTVMLGAVGKAARVLNPAQRAAVSKHVNLVAKQAASARRLAGLAKRAQGVGAGTLTFSKSAAAAIKASFAPKWKRGTRVGNVEIGAEAMQLFEDFYTAIGASPDPDYPGFLDDGSPDPAFMDPAADDISTADAAMDAGAGSVVAPDGTVIYDPATDPALTPMPARGGTISPEEASETWQNVPPDGIVYDGSRGLAENAVGSWNAFYGAQKHDGWGVPSFLRGSVDGGKTIQWLYYSPETADKGFQVAGREFQTLATSGAPECKGVSANSLQRGWGPIVGNPKDPFFANLQYAVAEGLWFWQGPYAPRHATSEADAKIAAANKKIVEANRMAALVVAAQMQKDLLDRQEAKAKQDAANALAQSAADTQSQIVKQQVEAQASQLDMQTQKAELDYQKQQALLEMQTNQAMLEDAKREAALDAAAQQQIIEQASVWNEWAKQNPAEAVAQMQGGGMEEGEEMEGGDFAEGEEFAEDDGGYDGSGINPLAGDEGDYEGQE